MPNFLHGKNWWIWEQLEGCDLLEAQIARLTPTGNRVLQPEMFKGCNLSEEEQCVFEHVSLTASLFHLCNNEGA